MRQVIAQGTFDILYPGRVHYLSDVASLGDELHVIIARGENVAHRPKPILGGHQCRDMAAAPDIIDEAHLGRVEDIPTPIEKINPNVITPGYDQHHDEDGIKAVLDARGIDCEVMRATPRELRHDDELLSAGRIIDRIIERRC